jgi:16S rRNA (cytosine1407-C5)-methyltransferase
MYVDREDKEIPLWHHRAYQWGWYYIQESAASLPPSVIDYSPDDIILDMCAAPWGKTTQLATSLLALWGKGFVVANEIDNTRRSTLKETVTRMGLYNVTVSYRFSHWWAENYPSTFDHIVVDAVCSGEGTCFRTTDFMDDWGLWLTHKNAQIQRDIMRDAIACVKPWGTIIFSTCTLNTNENEWVVAWVLENYGDQVELVPVSIAWSSPWLSWYGLSDEDCLKVARLWPHIHQSWGFWVSKFIKRRDAISARPWKKNISIESCTSNNCGSRAMLKSQFGITLPEHTRIYEDKWFGYLTTTQKLAWFESGLPILKLGHGGITPLQPLIPALWHLSDLPRIDLDDEQIQQWMMNTQIEYSSPLTKGGAEGGGIKWWVIVSCHWFDVGLGKVGWGVLKNKSRQTG